MSLNTEESFTREHTIGRLMKDNRDLKFLQGELKSSAGSL